jgi:RNA polymerase sigma-70 factor (ECF subfamily)
MRRKDPLANPAPLIRRVYSYVAYRIGDGPEAEDVTSEVFERAIRYRSSYDQSRGWPLPWLLGIARRCIDDSLIRRPPAADIEAVDQPSGEDLEDEAVRRLVVSSAVEKLDDRSRELIALRYGADLRAREIGEVLDMKTNAVEVALHRALARLRAELEGAPAEGHPPRTEPAPRSAP